VIKQEEIRVQRYSEQTGQPIAPTPYKILTSLIERRVKVTCPINKKDCKGCVYLKENLCDYPYIGDKKVEKEKEAKQPKLGPDKWPKRFQ